MSYQYETIRELLELADAHGLSFAEVVLRAEAELTEMSVDEIKELAKSRIAIFKESIRDGLQDMSPSKSGMSGGQAGLLFSETPTFLGESARKAMIYALAVNEANAKMFRIVACPTAGSCGILPGCMEAVGEVLNCTEVQYVDGFMAAAGIGKIITDTACVAGAVGGCQAEVGTAAAMSAAAVTAMVGGSNEAIAHAAALSLKNVLGLVCDPVAGLVEVPCVKRNGMFAVQALTAAEMALGGLRSRIPPDEVIFAMDKIGRALPAALRETAEGGLAVTPSGLKIAELVKEL